MQNVSNFKVLQEQNVQVWMKENIFGKVEWLQDFLMGQGTLILGLIVVTVLLGVYFLLKKLLKSTSPLVDKMKKKLMYSPIFRSQIQFYLPTCLVCWEYFRTQDDKMDFKNLPGSIIKLCLLLSLPVFANVYLSMNAK